MSHFVGKLSFQSHYLIFALILSSEVLEGIHNVSSIVHACNH